MLKNKEGVEKTYHKNGKLATIGKLDKKGEKTGIWKTYYATGKLQEICNFNSTEEYGEYTRFHPDGKTISMQGNKFVGDVKFFGKKGDLMMECNVDNGKLNGKSFHYFPNGSISHYGYFKDDLEEGEWTHLFEKTGDLQALVNLKKGKLNGVATFYYEGDGLRVEKKETLKNGLLSGKSEFFWKDGKSSGEGKYKEGNPHGKWIYLDEAENHAGTITFKEGEIINVERGEAYRIGLAAELDDLYIKGE